MQLDPRRVTAVEHRVEDGDEPAEHDAEEEVDEEVLARDGPPGVVSLGGP